MRILFICHRHPYPPKRGGKIRPFNVIKHLTEQGHEVHVCSLTRSTEEAKEGTDLKTYAASVFSAEVSRFTQSARMIGKLLSSDPSSMGYFFSPDLKQYVDTSFNRIEFDFIFVHCSSVAQYVSHVKGIPKHLDFGDMDSQKWLEYSNYKPFPQKYGYLLEGKKLQLAETELSEMFDLCTTTTLGELETLNSYGTSMKSGWFPNGVDASFFSPVKEYDKNLISFIGRMDYFPNQEGITRFVKTVFPLIRKKNSLAKLVIVGADPPQSILKLADVENVSVTGSVPDVRPFITTSALSVVPLAIARGTQNKILESMAMGVPVLSSEAAAKGVDALRSEQILVSDDPLETAELAVKVMSERAYRDKIAANGRQCVLTNHSWHGSMKKLDMLLTKHFHFQK
jgi:polysaccharide biosynthesis protein PslH